VLAAQLCQRFVVLAQQFPARTRSRSPVAVSVTPRPVRCKSGCSTMPSSLCICMLSADCVRPTRRAAWPSTPVSAMATKLRKRSMSSDWLTA
jgi:hypothetical protein